MSRHGYFLLNLRSRLRNVHAVRNAIHLLQKNHSHPTDQGFLHPLKGRPVRLRDDPSGAQYQEPPILLTFKLQSIYSSRPDLSTGRRGAMYPLQGFDMSTLPPGQAFWYLQGEQETSRGHQTSRCPVVPEMQQCNLKIGWLQEHDVSLRISMVLALWK